MQLSPLRAGLTACEGQLILADTNDFLDLGANSIELTHFRGR